MADQTPRLTSLSPGAGCACKLPLAKLEELFASMGPAGYPGLTPAGGDLLIGAAEGDDAAVLRLDDERALVLTTDFFTPIVDDPYDWGRIAAANALSDVYAMGGRPLFAVNLAAWPGDGLDVAILGQVLRGGAQVGAEAGCFVAGGHTIDDPVPKYGLAVVGLADPARLLTIDRAVPGDQLIVTKAIGTGVIATAVKYGAPPPDVLAAAIASMTLLNAGASEAALAAGVPGRHRRDRVQPARPPAPDAGRQRRGGPGHGQRGTAAARRGGAGRGRFHLRRDPGQRRAHRPGHQRGRGRPGRAGHAAVRRADLRRAAAGRPARGGGRPAR